MKENVLTYHCDIKKKFQKNQSSETSPCAARRVGTIDLYRGSVAATCT